MPYDSSPERLNALGSFNNAEHYLEVGVAKGATFFDVNIANKVAVDPSFQFDHEPHVNEHTALHKTTSDVYFREIAEPDRKFDVLFLDGLHTFEQTFRDFCASLGHSHSRSIWVIDDTVPTSMLAAHPDGRTANRWRKLLLSKDGRWMGDVYKVIFAIHDFFPQFRYATFPNHGQTVIWRETRKDFSPEWNCLCKISRLGYSDFLKYQDPFMAYMDADQILAAVQKGLPAA